MTFQLTVLYLQPDDPAAFDAYYEATHAPLASLIPGLRAYTAIHAQPGPDGTPPEAYLVATLSFDDAAGLRRRDGQRRGPCRGRRTSANFATGASRC